MSTTQPPRRTTDTKVEKSLKHHDGVKPSREISLLEASHPPIVTPDDIPASPSMRPDKGNRVPYFRYFGATAIVPGFKQMVVSVRDRRRSGGSHSGASPLSTPSGILGAGSVSGSEVVIEDLPVYDPNGSGPVHPLILHLVKTFFMHVGCNYPFLKQHRFIRMVMDKAVEPILVDAVCAIAARFSDAPALTGGNEKMRRSERGHAFAQRAKQATVDTFPCPSVGAVQACLLMAYEGFGANQDSALWMYLGLAIRMAVDLGLQKRVGIQYQGEKDPWYTRNRGRTNGDADSPEEKKYDEGNMPSLQEQREVEQERIDTFWAVFVLDRVISSGTGRPVTFREDDFDLPLPAPSLDPATGWPAPLPIFLEIIHLYGRVSDVLNNIHGIQDLTQEKRTTLSKMEHQLTRIYKNWDARLQFNVSNFKAYLSDGQGTTFILLHFWFHALFIILHQPTLMSPFGDLRSELQLLPDSRELSMSSAKTICDILAFADLIDPKSFIGNPFTSQPIYIAACAFLMESSMNASEGSSREGSPPALHVNHGKDRPGIPGGQRTSRHSLLASAANQNYQRCYISLQHMHVYWGGVKYILTALDQKSKGIWDCETYTLEEYESTKGPLSTLEHQSPKPSGPPIAWSLAGTANSPNSSLTLMYQNLNGAMASATGNQQSIPTQASTPPGNMVYDPIRQSLPAEAGGMYPPAFPLQNSARRAQPHRISNLSAGTHGQPTHYDKSADGAEGKRVFTPAYTPTSQRPNNYDAYAASPVSNMTDNRSGSMHMNQNMYYGHNLPYQSWEAGFGNMDAITFDSQDIDIGALGLHQPDLMSGWLDYIPNDVLGLLENHDMGQGHGQNGQ